MEYFIHKFIFYHYKYHFEIETIQQISIFTLLVKVQQYLGISWK